jgi:hypothetical protein
MLTRSERPLTDNERRDLSHRITAARAESAKALIKSGGVAALGCGALALMTLLASDAPVLVIIGFWSALWIVFTLWIGLPWRRLMRQQIPIIEDGLRTNRARVVRLQSTRVVEFEEEEDEGACYAFAIDDGRSVFVVGQEFYEDDDFPNTDFSLIEILGAADRPIDTLLQKDGAKLQPERVIAARVKWTFDLPRHLQIIDAPVDRVESALASAPQRGRGSW